MRPNIGEPREPGFESPLPEAIKGEPSPAAAMCAPAPVEMLPTMCAEKFRAGVLAAARAAGPSDDVDLLIREAAYVLCTPDVQAGELFSMLGTAIRLLRASIAAGMPELQQAPLVTLVECLHAAVLRPEAPALHITGKRGAVYAARSWCCCLRRRCGRRGACRSCAAW